MTEGGVDEVGVFHKIPWIDDLRLAEIFAREVLSMLVRKELLSPEWAEHILSWRHTGFNVHSLVRTKTKPEPEWVGKSMIRPLLALERPAFLEPEGKVGYRWGRKGAEREMMDYVEFIARATSHVPNKGQATIRYLGLYANAIFIDHLKLMLYNCRSRRVIDIAVRRPYLIIQGGRVTVQNDNPALGEKWKLQRVEYFYFTSYWR